MGEAKRKELARAAGIAVARTHKVNYRLEQRFRQTREEFQTHLLLFGQVKLLEACTKSPMLADAWFRMIAFAQSAKECLLTEKEVVDFWGFYWEDEIVKALGQVDIKLPENWMLVTRIKGAALAAAAFLAEGLSANCDPDLLEKACSQYISIGECTLEVALAYHAGNIIYWGNNLLVHTGQDTEEEAGEIMIAVKHSSGCWNYFPSSDNNRVSLSDYKLAKSAVEQYPRPIQGELIHSQSGKIARLLGMEVKDNNYAYLVR
ncbi:MAG: hypothetical protein M3N42_03825 [Cyanobacteriota bacterium]|nr:hypothetical protein [Cyanobacteriota bacterium]